MHVKRSAFSVVLSNVSLCHSKLEHWVRHVTDSRSGWHCSDVHHREQHVYKVLAALKFIVNRRFDNEKMFSTASTTNALPQNLQALSLFKEELGIFKTYKTTTLWEIEVVEKFDPCTCISFAQSTTGASSLPIAPGDIVKTISAKSLSKD